MGSGLAFCLPATELSWQNTKPDPEVRESVLLSEIDALGHSSPVFLPWPFQLPRQLCTPPHKAQSHQTKRE